MKIRHDAVAISSVLFTVALLVLMPAMLGNALTTYQTRFRDFEADTKFAMVRDQVAIPNYFAPFGFASLAIIGIGLIVTWAAYIKGVRWTWFVILVITWVWAFPVFVLPYLQNWNRAAPIAQAFAPSEILRLLESAISEGGMARGFVTVALAFLLMVVALVLPVKSFIRGRTVAQGGPGAQAS